MKKSLQRKVVSAKAQNQNGHTKEHAETNKKGMKNGIAHKEEHDDDHENMVDELNGADTGYNSRLRVRKAIRKLSYESHIQSCSFDDEGELYLGKKRKGGKRKIKHVSSKPVFCVYVESQR